MKEQLTKRLEQLKSEFELGQKMLAELDARRQSLQQTLLRVSGAIQVLEEECAKDGATAVAVGSEAGQEEPVPRMAVAGR